jgi:hypothetical protein
MLSSGMQCYHVELLLSSGVKCYHLELMLSSGANVIIWDEMISSGAKIMLQNGANVIIRSYPVMLASGMITTTFLFFLKTSLTPG